MVKQFLSEQNSKLVGLLPFAEIEEKLEQVFAAWSKDIWDSVANEISEDGPLAGLNLKPSAEEIALLGEHAGEFDLGLDDELASEETTQAAKSAKAQNIVQKKGPTQVQKIIISQNVALLSDRQAFTHKAKLFDNLLNQIGDIKARQQLRARYCIHLDYHHFKYGLKDFSSYYFPCAVSFDGAVLGQGDVSFEQARFAAPVSFAKTRFGRGMVSFDGAGFADQFYLSHIETNMTHISARKASFGKDILLVGKFDGIVDFSGSSFNGQLRFSDAKFSQLPDLSSVHFASPPSLAGLKISRAPLTRIWPPANWRNQKNPDSPDHAGDHLPKSRLRLFSRNTSIDEVAKARALKQIATQFGDIEKRGELFAYEMRAKRGVETTSRIGLLLNSLYYHFSNFGQSLTRPIAWLALSFVGFLIAYMVAIGFSIEGFERLAIASKLSLTSLLPLGLANAKGALAILSTMQQGFGAILAAFLALGVYNKFRLK